MTDQTTFSERHIVVFIRSLNKTTGAFELYHPNDDVLNGGALTPAAALASRTQDAYAAIDDASIATRNESAIESRGFMLKPSAKGHRRIYADREATALAATPLRGAPSVPHVSTRGHAG
jgi:hypothetical protein